MKQYELKITKKAVKDIQFFSEKEKQKCITVLRNVISKNPYIGKKLKGKLAPNYSYRLSIKDRIIYEIDSQKKVVYIKRLRTHYGD